MFEDLFFFNYHTIFTWFFAFISFFSNILLSVYRHLILTMTLTLTFRYKCQQPSQPVTATIELSCENSMLVMRTVLRWIYQNSANTPKVHILIKHYQIHKERGKITFLLKPLNEFLCDKYDIFRYLSLNCKVLELYNHPYTEIK